MSEPTEEMVIAGIAAANRTMPYVSYAPCVAAIWKAMQAANSQAMPQGLDEWIERNELVVSIDAAVEFVVTVEDLRAYLSGMAIVPVEPTHGMCLAGNALLLSSHNEQSHGLRKSAEETSDE